MNIYIYIYIDIYIIMARSGGSFEPPGLKVKPPLYARNVFKVCQYI